MGSVQISLQQNIVCYFIHNSSYFIQNMQEIKFVGWGGGGECTEKITDGSHTEVEQYTVFRLFVRCCKSLITSPAQLLVNSTFKTDRYMTDFVPSAYFLSLWSAHLFQSFSYQSHLNCIFLAKTNQRCQQLFGRSRTYMLNIYIDINW